MFANRGYFSYPVCIVIKQSSCIEIEQPRDLPASELHATAVGPHPPPWGTCGAGKPSLAASADSDRWDHSPDHRCESAPSGCWDPIQRSLLINSLIPRDGLFPCDRADIHPDSNACWRISPAPFTISRELAAELEALGPRLLAYYKACNTLYFQSVRGILPGWAADYLDRGKPESVIEYGRMRRFKQVLPRVIRPDIILTGDGYVITELDSVPGGIGLTACLGEVYARFCPDLVGGHDGMVNGLAASLGSLHPAGSPKVAFVVSEESASYRNEMEWLAGALSARGWSACTARPEQVVFTEEHLSIASDCGPVAIDMVYRFFELFDLKNIPKSELVLYSAKKGRVTLTPPVKPYLEEKLLFALLFHPRLTGFWLAQLGEDTLALLKKLFPATWILDPRPLPPHGIIPGLLSDGRQATDWMDIASASQRERAFVVKPSGFSPLSWGSRGVRVGQDMPAEEWRHVLKQAIESFDHTPHILQEFRKGASFGVDYYDFGQASMERMRGRVRLCPYYFVVGEDEVRLSGILATICPADKKLIHGMGDAVMVPCAVG